MKNEAIIFLSLNILEALQTSVSSIFTEYLLLTDVYHQPLCLFLSLGSIGD